MKYRTEQDNDISLYSYAELETMLKILNNPHSNSYVPFTFKEIISELNKRNKQP